MVYLIHRFYTKAQATKRVREILNIWERKGYDKPNDVPPTDDHILEFLQLMKGLGTPVDYAHKERLKKRLEEMI